MGEAEGDVDGTVLNVGLTDGIPVGESEGTFVGSDDGANVGSNVFVGPLVGASVMGSMQITKPVPAFSAETVSHRKNALFETGKFNGPVVGSLYSATRAPDMASVIRSESPAMSNCPLALTVATPVIIKTQPASG